MKWSKKIRTAPILLMCLVFLPLLASAQGGGDEVTVMLSGDVPLTLVKVPAGVFQMGSPPGERGNIFDNETQHQVTLTQDYYIGKTEVTQAQWEAVMGTPMRTECGAIAVGDEFPVYCVNWNRINGAGGFMEKLNQQLGTMEFRLPTEAEWERAARAGTATRYAHGDVLECSDECEACAAHDPNMWWCGNAVPFAPQLVGPKLPNQFGLQDMHGTRWEVVNDLYEEFTGASATDPTGPVNNDNGDVVMKGGGNEANFNRSASRLGTATDDRSQNDEVGFRVAATSLEGLTFQINSGLNDAWYSPATNGQGFLVAVFPDIKQMFIAWFTYDTERPPEDVTAFLGEPGHRWLTAQGPYEGDTATLTIFVTSGGVFDAANPPAVTDPAGDGTMTIKFVDCTDGLVSYEITSLDISGEIPIERIVLDNIPLCETLASP
jgi:formylglycine-generating enzyme required for sulfatase activity